MIQYDHLGVWYHLTWSSRRDTYFLMGGTTSIFEALRNLQKDPYFENFRCFTFPGGMEVDTGDKYPCPKALMEDINGTARTTS